MKIQTKKELLLLSLICFLPVFCLGQILDGFQSFVYKRVDTTGLKIYVKYPEIIDNVTSCPAIIFFFGGGWQNGTVNQFKPHAEYFASRGMVTIVADYRVADRHHTSPFDAVSDAKSAIRYVRKNAGKLKIDASRVVASGGSAGGHLAAATALIKNYNDGNDDLSVSCIPNALVLFNPVIDNGPGGYGFERIGEKYKDFSPIHNIGKGAPPTIIFLGTNDHLIPVETAQYYKKIMERTGSRCDLMLYEDQGHGFFNFKKDSKTGNKYYDETLNETDKFLVSLGFIRVAGK